MPPQAGQAPYGLLKENMRGETSGKDTPHLTQASRSEKSIAGPSTTSTWATPSASRSAVSRESASRVPSPSRTMMRSTTTSMVCFLVLASSISSPSSCTCPLTRTRTKPWRLRSKKSLRYSPFRPRTTGARTRRRLPPGSVSTRSTICCTV